MKNNFPGGVWPVMLTPFTKNNEIDYVGLESLIEWYINKGASGLFAVCQSSEMFSLTNSESIEIASFTKRIANNRVPVIASGHTADDIDEQINQLNNMVYAGVDAVILITNRFAKQNESEAVFLKNVYKVIDSLPSHMPLGFYECPYPYKRLISPDILRELAKTGRFYFLKDTCSNAKQIKNKYHATSDTNLKIFNANSATLLDTLRGGIAGYSGVMANFQPELYVWLTENFNLKSKKVEDVQNLLSICSFIEKQNYPRNAKYNMQLEGLELNTATRNRLKQPLNETEMQEVRQLRDLTRTFT